MTIAWIYLDKRSAALDALKDHSSMGYIIRNHPDALEEAEERLTSVHLPAPTGMPRAHNPHAGESRLAASLDEIDVLKERYRRALEYMEWFQPAWDALSEEERNILTMLFLTDGMKSEAVEALGERLGLERAQVYRRKEKAVAHLALLLYGK